MSWRRSATWLKGVLSWKQDSRREEKMEGSSTGMPFSMEEWIWWRIWRRAWGLEREEGGGYVRRGVGVDFG